MANERPIIIDLSGALPCLGVSATGPVLPGAASLRTLMTPASVCRAVLRATSAGLLARAGDEALDWREDEQTLVCEQALTALPQLEDAELQSHLLRAIWEAICQTLTQHGWLKPARRWPAFVIPPRHWPPVLLERWRQVCATEHRLKLAGFISEAVALSLGFLQSDLFRQAAANHDFTRPVTVALLGITPECVEVVCFDYTSKPGIPAGLLLRDHFQTTARACAARLQACDWLADLKLAVWLESPALTAALRAELTDAAHTLEAGAPRRCLPAVEPRALKMSGAAKLALCALGRGEMSEEVVIGTAYHLGLRVNQAHFHTLLDKATAIRLRDFPYTTTRAFKLQGQVGNEWRISLCCGYAERVDEALTLGQCTLKQPELAQLAQTGAATLAAAVRLDAPGRGEVLLGMLPDDRVLGRLEFTLPGLVV